MKKVLAILLGIFALIFFVSADAEDGPSITAKLGFKAILERDEEALLQMMPPEEAEEVSSGEMKMFLFMANAWLKGQGVTSIDDLVFSETITGDNATLIITAKKNGKEIGTEEYVKIDGEWVAQE
ncbi:MAG: hypothetical protein LBV20_00360 [Treponema sp.]|jgi:malate synthase|nr:hypothetical protein [Treponema sp.]